MAREERVGRNGKVEEVAGLPIGSRWEDLDTWVALIQALIALGLVAVEEMLQRDVELLAGPWYAWGTESRTGCDGADSASQSTCWTRRCRSGCPGCGTGG